MKTTLERLTFHVAEEAGAVDVTATSKLRSELGMDSIDISNLIESINEEFQISVSENDLDKCITVADVVTLIDKKLGV